jgi:hypothetical protein
MWLVVGLSSLKQQRIPEGTMAWPSTALSQATCVWILFLSPYLRKLFQTKVVRRSQKMHAKVVWVPE